MSAESFDSLSGDMLVAMFHAAKQWARDEQVDIYNMGKCRLANMLRDTHVGLPLPEPGDFVFEGVVNGIAQEFLVRNYKVVWNRPTR